MSTGHCRHCTDACKATRVLSGNPAISHANGDGVRWGSGQCPACAEAERIVAEIDASLAVDLPVGMATGLARVVRIARGER